MRIFSKEIGAEKRLQRRDALRARYAQPQRGFWAWGRAWVSMFFVDHGFFRYVYLNFHKVGQNAWRSAQPGPVHVRRYARKGIRTVINLRGGREFGSYPLERDACAEQGLAFEEIVLRSRGAPEIETIEDVARLFERVQYPVVFHCKSGADRAGLMSALYLLLQEQASPSEAKKQLSLRYGHIRQGKTGILDAFVEMFEQARAQDPKLDFMDWVRNDYDPDALTRSFRSNRWGSFLVDRILARE
ncbi:MAG: sulfur transferase domain-containing protein [Neomegalonema sp.]|nr:sulfur transferase domain-containing protein [Neomegalonema sp.]